MTREDSRITTPEERGRAVRRRSHRGLVLAAVVIGLAGFAIAIVEALRLPKGSVWAVVIAAAVVVGVIRAWTTRDG